MPQPPRKRPAPAPPINRFRDRFKTSLAEPETSSSKIRSFTADHAAPAHPRVLEATFGNPRESIEPGYGADTYTKQAERLFKATFGVEAEVFFVAGGGTAANSLALASLVRSTDSVLCTQDAHLTTNEGGSAEFYTRAHLLALPSFQAKLHPDQVARELYRRGRTNPSQPSVISVSQPTEIGSVYTIEELQALTHVAHSNGLSVHMDGARLFHAAAALHTDLKALTTEVGVDVLSLGLGKNGGLGFGDAVVFLNPELVPDHFRTLRRQAGHDISKTRYHAPQWVVMLADGLGLQLAQHANAMMGRLAGQVEDVPHLAITNKPVETNCLLTVFEAKDLEKLQEKYEVPLRGDPEKREVRFMTSYVTTPEETDQLAQDMKDLRKIGFVGCYDTKKGRRLSCTLTLGKAISSSSRKTPNQREPSLLARETSSWRARSPDTRPASGPAPFWKRRVARFTSM